MTNPIKVFVVEDTEMYLGAFLQMAKLPEYHDIQIILVARNEKEALKVMQSQNFDVALVDMQLPIDEGRLLDNEAGLRIVSAITSQPGAPKVLAFSAPLEKPEFIIRVIRAGASGYVRKRGTTPTELFDAIRRVYKGRKVFPEDITQYAIGQESNKPQLSTKELELWQLIAKGHKDKEIADMTNLSLSRVKHIASELYIKIGVANRAQAVRKWVEDQYGTFSDIDSEK